MLLDSGITAGATSSVVHQPPVPNNEDCLTINVWTGAVNITEKRSIMVWIHGGGFQFGSSAKPAYNGTTIAGQGVMLVNFKYILGVFGFLGLEELDQEGRTPSGNFGLQDMLTALRWVKANIAAFGDLDHVTLFGQSAESHSVGLPRPSPIAKEEELFHKGTMESRAW